MEDRTRALHEIAALARAHGITAAEIVAGLEEAPAAVTAEAQTRDVLVRVLGYLGGTFVFAGIGVFIAMHWDRMGPAARVVVTLGPGVAAFILGMLAVREARYATAVTPMLLVAAALEPTGMLVAFNEYGSGGDWRAGTLVAMGTTALQFGLASGATGRSTPLFLTVFFGTLAWWSALDLLDLDGELIAVILGGCMLLAAAGIDRTRHGQITSVYYFAGAAAFLGGLFELVQNTVLEIVFLAVASAFMYLSVVLHSRALLAVSTLAILAYTGWFTGQHFADSVGWPLALVAFGIALIALSALAYRIDRQYMRPRARTR